MFCGFSQRQEKDLALITARNGTVVTITTSVMMAVHVFPSMLTWICRTALQVNGTFISEICMRCPLFIFCDN